MRALLLTLVVACHPSASVERTTPVANLQSYSTVGLRVRSSTFASQGVAMMLENSVIGRLREQCSFAQVARAGDTPDPQHPADVVLDLNITKTARGGSGWIRNENQVQIDTLLVLSDGHDGDLLGTATIHGKSSGTVINNAPQENEAIDAIAKAVATLLSKSGCAGPRVARVDTPTPNQGSASQGSAAQGSADQGSGAGSGAPATPDESRRADAEKLNDQGKEKLFNADVAGALALFQQANSVLPDPKYQFNVCVALGAQEKWDQAIAACNQARSMNPPAKLAAKIDQRLEGLKNHQ